MNKSVLLVSWEPNLARTREMLLRSAGYSVTSAVGRAQAHSRCRSRADLLVLGHSVPMSDLLRSNQQKLPEADFGVEAFEPADVVGVVRKILHDEV